MTSAAVAEQCQNQCIALTNLSDKIKLVNGLIFQLNMTDKTGFELASISNYNTYIHVRNSSVCLKQKYFLINYFSDKKLTVEK